jgi:UDP-GlcNAc3NAcA epimerase
VRVATIVGARPQFIKAAVVSPALRATGRADEVIVHTGQHYDANLSEVFFRQLGITEPAFNLGIGGGTNTEQTGRMLVALERVLAEISPDMVLVYGDTNSTLAGALAASQCGVRLAHVEAGLRSWNRAMAEETNRVLTDHAADILFAPTQAAVDNLCREGIEPGRTHMVGDVMYDLALRTLARNNLPDIHAALGIPSSGYAVATVHRAENTDDPARLRAIVGGLIETANRLPVVWPVHPRAVQAAAREGISLAANRNLFVVDPVGYEEMLSLIRGSTVVVTDSGGVQKEAFFVGRPGVILRAETEWTELVESGWSRLAPPADSHSIAATIAQAADDPLPAAVRLYGNGNAGELIAQIVTA